MKALTLHQPYASLIAVGVKWIETRPWSTSYRGPLAIHAAKREMVHISSLPDGAHFRYPRSLMSPDTRRFASDYQGSDWPDPAKHPLGAVVAVCDLTDVVPIVGLPASSRLVDEARQPHLWVAPTAGGLSLLSLCQECSGSGIDELLDGDAPCGGCIDEPLEGRVWTDVSDQLPFGDFTPGRYAFMLDNVRPLDEPVSCKGRQGLWTLPDDVAALVGE